MPFKPNSFFKFNVNHYDFFINLRDLHKIFYTLQGEAMNKNQKQFIRPPYDSRFDQLNIINWNFPQNPTFQHGKYCIRFTLILGDGSTLNRQKGGFASAKEAMKYRDNLIVKL